MLNDLRPIDTGEIDLLQIDSFFDRKAEPKEDSLVRIKINSDESKILISKLEKYLNHEKINKIKNLEELQPENLGNNYFSEELNEIRRIRRVVDNPNLDFIVGGHIIDRVHPNQEIDYLDNLMDLNKGIVFDISYLRESARMMAGADSVLLYYGLERELTRFVQGIELPEFVRFLAGFAKEGREIPEEELSRYGLRLDTQGDRSHYGRRFSHKYFDTPFNFCLTYDGKLIASVGFKPEEGRVFIEQIQGIRGEGDKLKPFKWERALVNYVVDWARNNGIPEVAVVSSKNNKWTERHFHLSPEQGKMLYDVTAKRCGFKLDKKGNYVKRLEERVAAAA